MGVVANSMVNKRHLIVPLDELFDNLSFRQRNKRYAEAAVALAAGSAQDALENAGIAGDEIDYMVVVSCTGFMMPGPDAYLANILGCRPDMRRITIQQLGCAAGVSALSCAARFVQSKPQAKALVIAVELPSLLFQPDKYSPRYLASVGLFADAAGAVLVGDFPTTEGIVVDADYQHLLPSTQDVIMTEVSEKGIDFDINPRIPYCARRSLKEISTWLREREVLSEDLDFCVAHTGGPSVIQAIGQELSFSEDVMRFTRDSLAEIGNTESVSVLDVLRRQFKEAPANASTGIILAFGPGFTTEAILGTWKTK